MEQTSDLQKIVKAPSSVTRFWLMWTFVVTIGATWIGATQVQISQLITNQAKIQVENKNLQAIVNNLLTTVETIVVQTATYQEFDKQRVQDLSIGLSKLEFRVITLSEKI